MIGSLAWKNLARRPTRAFLLVVAVALSSSALLAAAILLLGLDSSLERGLARLGADLCVASREALVNPTSSLLVGEAGQPPLASATVAAVGVLPGVSACAPQRVLRLTDPDFCGQSSSELVAFEPARDFTVLPWVEEGHLPRPFGDGDVIVGCRHPFEPGEAVSLGGVELTVWGRLAPSGVGPHERGLFVPLATVPRLEKALAVGQPSPSAPSVLLLRLADGFTPEAVRFSLAQLGTVRVVEGEFAMIDARRSVVALLSGILALGGLMLAVTALMIAVVFSAVVGERRSELGVLLAVGMSPGRVVRLLASEAGLATGLGGLLGLAGAAGLLRLAEHTLLASLTGLGVAFSWPSAGLCALLALAGFGLATLVGVLGAAYPAWRLARRDPYELLRQESA